VLVAAFGSDHPRHAVARDWLDKAVSACRTGAPLTLMPMVPASFLRLVTSAKTFRQATQGKDAVAFIDAILAAPGVRLASLGPEWSKLRQRCLDKQLAGNDLADAWLSAAFTHRGEHLVTFERDFRELPTRSQFTLLARAWRDRCGACGRGDRTSPWGAMT
jgi:toxin-antitoxin system PIN domain toxin